jgi:uncharacterized damage-inducible protein DinB
MPTLSLSGSLVKFMLLSANESICHNQTFFMKEGMLWIVSCLLLFGVQADSQSLTPADLKLQMIKDWKRAKDYTIEYLNTMPADKYSFKPVDSIRNFAGQMLHLAAANVLIMSQATDDPPLPWARLDMANRPSAQNKDSVVYYVTASFDYAISAIQNSDATKWGEKKKGATRSLSYEETRFALINKAFEHQTHTLGQTTIYIRLQGIKPPQEKLW